MIVFHETEPFIGVPRALLEECLGVLVEARKHLRHTPQFDEDILRAIAQLKAFLDGTA